MHVFLQVAGVGPTADGLSPSSESPSETTETGEGKGKDEDRWDATTPKDTIDEVPVVPVDNEILAKDGRGSELYKVDSPKEVTSENTWERTDVLAGKAGFPSVSLLHLNCMSDFDVVIGVSALS